MDLKVTIVSLVILVFLSNQVLFSHLSDQTQSVEPLATGTVTPTTQQVIIVKDYQFTGLLTFTIMFMTMLLLGAMPDFGFSHIQDRDLKRPYYRLYMI